VMAVGAWVDSKAARNQMTRWAALQLMAAGCGPLRTPHATTHCGWRVLLPKLARCRSGVRSCSVAPGSIDEVAPRRWRRRERRTN
jgi:hypothetical protein